MDGNINPSELYTEKLMNMILDAIDDIIIIHDSQHTIVWMNKAAEDAFGRPADDVIGRKCYTLFGNECSCKDCVANLIIGDRPVSRQTRRVIPGTNVICDCSAMPFYEEGCLKLVVQHLRVVDPDKV